MRAAVLHPGGRLSLEERAVPEPGEGEILVGPSAVGICGSDLHYYHDGHIGDWWIRQPHVLGHEFAGVVERLGSGVDTVAVGDHVAVEPIVPCDRCDPCARGLYNLCRDFAFLGSPHTDGALQEQIVVRAAAAHRLPGGMPLTHGALVEPTSIAVHAVRRGELEAGATVVVIGAGPIGLLVAAVALAHDAIVHVTDINASRLAIAEKLGVSTALDVRGLASSDIADRIGEREIDVAIEAVGAAATVDTALRLVRPGGRVVAVGVNADEQIPFDLMLAQEKEVTVVPVYLGRDAFPQAIDHLASGRIDADLLITDRFPLDLTADAFATAAGGGDAVKVMVEPSREEGS